ncbi:MULTISPECIES: LysR family transcriptional regulator [Enterobacteriaceae]|uniref:LysR family transcriptional regulator n=1 Tax=Enterobacteriaceae TaxID=543 RepID=UPI0015DBCD98|nr:MULTISPECIES: LysR family transcriptional regulator [unclassified Klebsiella]BBR59732.1 LysR family transcriptional regulator [Klebsiella sp. WP4-W18-ESBL-05]BBS90932.1 LysR family transcriptional regulator [Klebsiella sp. WP7-S18-CRE-02]BBS95955.1 LysR family transcriptional regulator [Klebsiella sp. WP7-S18-CRE-03]BBT00985.1 LysR family transcriptional regulator [Klebsiella sp. WP7-S18-ESBL-04]
MQINQGSGKTPLRKMKEYDLISLRSFVAVVESGSFNNAAIQLDTSSAAISRRVSALEAALSVKLINRTTRQLDLTPSGQQFYQDVLGILGALEQAEERLNCAQETYSGIIRLGAPVSFGTQKLAPLLPAFLKTYPQITVTLQLEDRVSDLLNEGIDLSLRIGELQDSSLVSLPIAMMPRLYCASPEYLKTHGRPASPAELKHHQCLHYSLLSTRNEWALSSGEQELDARVPLAANNGDVLREAAIQGMGIAMLPWYIVEDALRGGALVPVLERYAPPPLPLSIVRPSRQFTPVRVTVLMQYLRDALAGAGAGESGGRAEG